MQLCLNAMVEHNQAGMTLQGLRRDGGSMWIATIALSGNASIAYILESHISTYIFTSPCMCRAQPCNSVGYQGMNSMDQSINPLMHNWNKVTSFSITIDIVLLNSFVRSFDTFLHLHSLLYVFHFIVFRSLSITAMVLATQVTTSSNPKKIMLVSFHSFFGTLYLFYT